jgi:hypothetical protein
MLAIAGIDGILRRFKLQSGLLLNFMKKRTLQWHPKSNRSRLCELCSIISFGAVSGSGTCLAFSHGDGISAPRFRYSMM